MPRKILITSDVQAFGGTVVALSLLARALDPVRYAVTVALPDRTALEPVFAELDAAGIPTERLLHVGDSSPRAVPELRALLQHTSAELAHIHLSYPGAARWQLFAARSAGVPIVTTEHDPFPVRGLKKIAKRLTLSWTRKTIAISDWARELILGEYHLPLERVTRIWNGIDPARFRTGAVATDELREFRTHTPVLFTNSALHPRKGILTLLEAMRPVLAALPDALLLIVGEGEQLAELQAKAAQLGVADHVRFLLYRTDVPDLIAACDIAVQPSVREAFGLVVLEAMAAGKPVVASEVGGHVDTISPGTTGLLVPPEDPAALAEAILTLARDPARRERMGQAGSARVDVDFTVSRMADLTADLYDTIR